MKLVKYGKYSISRFSSTISTDVSFSGSKTGKFFQEEPCLGNQYECDPLLSKYLEKHLPKEVFKEINKDLHDFGHSVATNIYEHHKNLCNNEPILQQYNAWGKRVDQIIMHPSWRDLHDISAKEGLISIPYENRFSQWSRLYQAVKLYLFSPSSGLYSCPLAMTDGASFLLKDKQSEPFHSTYKHLISRDPNQFWTSGQWMTEKKGGSDVGNGTETVAKLQPDGTYRLYGYKWFTSATDADVALTLARIVDNDGNVTSGSKGLSMFYLATKKQDGSMNGIYLEKFKRKLGTRQMPTAEMILDGAEAHKVSDEGRGIATISPMLNITRIHNSISAVSAMRRMLNLSKDFARKRKAFGQMLYKHPLHIQTLARLEVEQQAAFLFLFKVVHLFGLVENKCANDQDNLLLRLFTPLLKLYTGKQAVAVSSEGVESFGGHGYLEDTYIPVMLRDSQVLSIWEGTTNVLSLDVIRAIAKTNGEVLRAYFSDVETKLDKKCESLSTSHSLLQSSAYKLRQFLNDVSRMNDVTVMTYGARDLVYSLSRLYMGCLLYENALSEKNETSKYMVDSWCTTQDLIPVVNQHKRNAYCQNNFNIETNLIYFYR